MFTTTKTSLPYVCLLTSVLALAGAGTAGPAYAQTVYDGDWGVVITTSQGSCEPSARFGLQISNGMVVNPAGGAADVRGRVDPRGAVQVTVRAGDQWAVGSGRLGNVNGGGVWRGQGSNGFCAGIWAAQRRGPAVTAEAPGGPLYNYAPGPVARAPSGPSGSAAAACEERFRSYDPATGTFLGLDGTRHPCP
jgi:hypothetical protein